MFIISILILVIVFLLIHFERKYFSNQKKQVQKYPFYFLRDKIILEIVMSNSNQKHEKIYNTVNSMIENLNYFNFSFYTYILRCFLNDIIEDAYKNDFTVNHDFLKKYKEEQMDPFEEDFIRLVLMTAKQNSFLLRLSMTKMGFKLLFTSQLLKSVFEFLKKHKKLFKTKQDKIQTVRDYSYLNYLVAQT